MSKNGEPKGCLAVILRLIGIRIGAPMDAPDDSDKSSNGPLPYRTRDDFLSPAELSFYRVLKLVIKDRGIICPKVNLADVLFVSKPNENQSYRNKIDRKHVDFLVCRPETMKPLFGVELDDKSHSRSDRVERDQFVERTFEAAKLPLERFPAKAAYDAAEISGRLAKYFGTQNAARPAASPPSRLAGESPTCPRCGVPMVKRVAAKGQNAGEQFWGCPNFPRCREKTV